MNRNVLAATERLERAVTTTSKQPRLGAKQPVDKGAFFSSFYKWIKNGQEGMPNYAADSRERDKWLQSAWTKEPHLAGVINSVVAIDRNREWALTGGRNVVSRYNNILRDAEDGEGWRYFFGRASLSFYTSDIGAVTEVARDGQDGPTRALYNVDPSKCYLTGDRATPLSYTPSGGKEQLWVPTDYFRTTPLPSIKEELRGLGFCAVSRIWALVEMMIAIYEHDMEQLGAHAPKGLMLLQNISEQQWVDAMRAREVAMSQKERDYYGGVAILAQEGVDQIDAKLVALSQLPAGFDLEQVTKLIMLGIALGFGYDPIEFWPIESGALGRGRETEIQHLKATGKGGVEFVRSYQDRLQGELPPNLLFEFEQRDVTGELADAQVAKAWADVFNAYYDKGMGLLTSEEARQLMVERGIIPSEWTLAEEQAQADSTGEQRAWLNHDAVWRSAFQNPAEPIVRYRSKTDRYVQLMPSGYDLIQHCRTHPAARSTALEMGEALRPEFRAMFNPRVYPVLTVRADEEEVLYQDDDVEITLQDVRKALSNGKKRQGAEFGGLLLAQPEGADGADA